MTTSSSELALNEPPAGVRTRLPFAAPGVRSRLPVRIIDRTPPIPPAPKFDVTPLVRALEAGFAQVTAQTEALLGSIERECVELALAAAERVVRRRCEKGELDLEAPLQELLASRRRELATRSATLRLHPEDAKLLQAKIVELAPVGATVELIADA